MSSVAANLEAIYGRIAHATEESGRSSSDVTLIAVTKRVPVPRIMEAYSAGVRHFGENRVQEALSKFAARSKVYSKAGAVEGDLVPREGITLHMIGSLQRNKAAVAAQFFDMVHSIDRVELAVALDSGFAKSKQLREGDTQKALPVLIEVNVTGEASKSGVTIHDLPRLAEQVSKCPHLLGVGLMTIASLGATKPEARRTFANLRQLLESLQGEYPGDWHHLSMGMSDDYEPAIREGATMVRLGRSIFGDRTAP